MVGRRTARAVPTSSQSAPGPAFVLEPTGSYQLGLAGGRRARGRRAACAERLSSATFDTCIFVPMAVTDDMFHGALASSDVEHTHGTRCAGPSRFVAGATPDLHPLLPADSMPRLQNPLISVVMPCFNEEQTVKQILDRVLESPLVGEVIAIDDASTDATLSILTAYDNPRLRVLAQEVNRGKGAALRRGFAEATGHGDEVSERVWHGWLLGGGGSGVGVEMAAGRWRRQNAPAAA